MLNPKWRADYGESSHQTKIQFALQLRQILCQRSKRSQEGIIIGLARTHVVGRTAISFSINYIQV